MMGMIDELDWVIDDALKHLKKMPYSIAENAVYWANGDHTWEKDTDGFIKELIEWRDELKKILVRR